MIRYTARGIRFGEIRFDEQPEPPLPDVLILRQRRTRPESGSYTTFHSFVTDLTENDQKLWDKIGKTCRYKIRRAETKDGVGCAIDPAPTPADIAIFIDFFNAFARQKSLAPIDRAELTAIARAGRLWLTRAEADGESVVRHSFLETNGTIRLLQSASLFRETDAETRAIIGRANRLLHWREILTFKERGLECLDWGGRFEDESSQERKGINDFKREFGGTPAEYFESWQALSSRGRVYMRLRALVHGAHALLAQKVERGLTGQTQVAA
jgi:hypothetical protein